MAGITVTPPFFSGGIDENINIFIRRFQGFLDGVGINPVGGQRDRAIGMLRSCLQGPAGEWYDENILGKRWKLINIFDNHGQGGMGALRGRTMAQMIASNSFRAHSLASTFANIGGNNAVTVGDVIARMVPVEDFEEDWTNSSGEPTDDPVNVFAGNNNPIVLNDIRIGQAVFYFKNNYPTVLEERRKIHFGNLEQGDEPIREFYRKLKHYGDLLHFGNEIVEHHFFKGLSPDNQLEVERIGADKSIEELVKSLERVEKRKSEMKLGLTKRTKANTYHDRPNLSEEIKSQVSGSSYKPSSGYSQEDVDRMIKSITEKITQNFQTQIQDLQAKIPTAPIKLPDAPDKLSDSNWNLEDKMAQLLKKSEATNARFAELQAQIAEDQLHDSNRVTQKMTSRMAERLEQKKLDREIDSLIDKINNSFNINDPDAMETNVVRDIATNDDEYTLQLVRKKK